MKRISIITRNLSLAAALLSTVAMPAKEKYGWSVHKQSASSKVMTDCSPAQSSAELSINNVRTIIFSGSDMWWDLFGQGNAYYVIPKVDAKAQWISSNFAGNVWFSGYDGGGNLKVAAQTYRQDGIDFWTGPLSTIDAKTSPDVCSQYDKIFQLTRTEVEDFVIKGLGASDNVKNWPGNGDISKNQDPNLAPYIDFNGDGFYSTDDGDYPYYDIYNNAGKDNLGVCKARVFGDKTLWWVYNDAGGIHTASQSNLAIGLEVRAQAFAFKTTDEINNMTFYNYQIINRAHEDLNNTYMSVWTDADLGYYGDDYIGCDIKRGLGFIYNGDAFDESVSGTNGYGTYIPSLGCDFFQGPLADANDHIDNDLDGITDELGEQIIMSNFTYFNNSFPGVPLQTTDPQNATQVRNYMTGFWRDGTPFTCGGNGYGGSTVTKYVYPDDTYPATLLPTCGTGWTEAAASNVPGDRRFVQSAGPFTLKAGAVNYITVGLPWARTTTAGNPLSSVTLLKSADDKAQALFDNCFKVLNGPEAPDLTIQELDNELILYLTNKFGSNNFQKTPNDYQEQDVTILPIITGCATGTITNYAHPDSLYRFEGYKIYQLKNDAVLQEELFDENKAKLAFQCDVKNGVTKLVNFTLDPSIGGDVPKVMVEGQDNGLQTSFHFTKDLFSSSSDQKVINNKTYYFMVVAYAYNNYLTYKEDVDCSQDLYNNKYGQKRPYLEGRINKKAYGIPHTPSPEKGGSELNSYYGYGPKVTRIEGQGNGGNILDLTQASIDEIFNNGDRVAKITYENGRGPLNIKVVDPLNVPNADFTVKFLRLPKTQYDPSNHPLAPVTPSVTPNLTDAGYGQALGDSLTWVLINNTNNKTYYPGLAIKLKQEFYFKELGLSVSLSQVTDAGSTAFGTDTLKNYRDGDLLDASITFAESTTPWLTGVPDVDGSNFQGVNDNGFNWIRSGKYVDNASPADPHQDDYNWLNTSKDKRFADPDEIFEKILGRTWAPFCLAAYSYSNATTNTIEGPAGPSIAALYSGSTYGYIGMDTRTLGSIDVIITSDRSKWTHCMVLEECDDPALAVNNAKKLEMRRSRSVDKDGRPLGDPNCNTSEAAFDTVQYGMGWFPGYAINIETGERLNMAFGEDSYQSKNGRDMMWNPTATVSTQNYPFTFGGRHYIYVFGNNKRQKYGTSPAALAPIFGKNMGAGTYKDLKDMVGVYKNTFGSSVIQLQIAYKNLMSDGMWVNIPVVASPKFEFTNPSNMPCDVKVRLRVKRAYRYGYASVFTPAPGGLTTASYPSTAKNAASNIAEFPSDISAAPLNNNFPMYTFTTSDIYANVGNGDVAKNALDLINIVPNPYYGYSTYETGNRLDTRVRITNLPNKCKIRIYTLNGTLVRTINRDVTGQEDIDVREVSDFHHTKYVSYQDWDLKNQSGITVASGLYIIHIDAPGLGEKILKWFGVMRPLDLQNY
ncbi:MAG: hypothetical protein JST26_07035 [Bacteroidetes bacterium]|nr:hypothetical protein [Bacteroidota bacterium]